jgi:hypothetical protein
MKKILIFICLLFLGFTFVAVGQGTTTMTIGTVTAPASGAALSVPINVTNLTSVGSITLKISYDPAVVTFTGVANAPTNVNFTSNAASGVITLIWYDATGTTPLTISTGKLVDLNFTYKGSSGALTFNNSQCEVTTGTGVVINGIAYNNGSITSNVTTSMTLGTVTPSAVGAAVSVPITATSLTGVGSITLKIAYNPAIATFTGTSNAPTGVTFTSNAANGVITLIWYDATGNTPLTLASGKLVDLNFTYVNGSSALTFNTAQCEVTTGTGVVISGITYANGSINNSAATVMTLGSVTPSAAGAAVSVPITVTNLAGVGSITLKIAYNPAIATFTGTANAPTGVTFTSNAANGVLTLIWYDATGNTPLTLASGKLVDLNFTYVSGSSALTFNTAQCEVTTGTGVVISGITYNNGNINSSASTTMTLGSVTAPAAGASVNVPITVTNLTSVGSVTLKIAYNPAVVTFTGTANAPTGVTFTSNAASGVITLIWYDATGNTPLTVANGKLVDLSFTYVAGSGTFSFNSAQCEVTNGAGIVISGISYNDGSLTSSLSTTMTLGAVTAPAVGAAVSIPITVANLTSVGSMTLKIAYNPAVVTFTGTANAPSGVTFTSNAANGVITLIWYDATGNTPLTLASGKLVDLNFTYVAGSGTFSFNSAQCEVTTSTGIAISGITYKNGSISNAAATTLTLGTVRGIAGSAVSVPITVVNLTSAGSITLKVAYDPAVVTFTGTANAPSGVTFTSNAANGVITLIWYDASGNTPLTIASGKLIDLNFTYISGSGTFTFNTAQCEVTSGSGVISTNVVYSNGAITGNQKPVFIAVSPITKNALDTVKFVVNATDPNQGDVLTYSTVGLPSGAKFDTTRTFSWIPKTGQYGSYKVSFLVSDGQLKDSMAVSITITKLPLIVLNTIPNTVLTDLARTVWISLTTPPVFGNNAGTLKYSVVGRNDYYIIPSIVRANVLQLEGIRNTGESQIRITVTATDTNASTISTSFYVSDQGTTSVTETSIPKEFSLSQNYPNPFNPSTSIKFGLPVSAPVTMEVYNVLGVKVRTLIHNDVMSAGIHQLEWNGKDDAGISVTSGVYLYRINAGTFQVTKKMMMLK